MVLDDPLPELGGEVADPSGGAGLIVAVLTPAAQLLLDAIAQLLDRGSQLLLVPADPVEVGSQPLVAGGNAK